MPGEADAFAATTLLVAVAEQALAALGSLDPPADRDFVTRLDSLRDEARVLLLLDPRFNVRPGTP